MLMAKLIAQKVLPSPGRALVTSKLGWHTGPRISHVCQDLPLDTPKLLGDGRSSAIGRHHATLSQLIAVDI